MPNPILQEKKITLLNKRLWEEWNKDIKPLVKCPTFQDYN